MAQPVITKKLQIAIPVEASSGGRIWVHSTPLSREVFEAHWEVMAATMARVFSSGLSVVAGPGVAALALRDMAKKMNCWDGPDGVQNSLMPEIVRLSNVIAPRDGGAGWAAVPLAHAARQGMISEDTAREVEDELVFFMLVSAVNRRDQSVGILESAAGLWGFRTTLLNSTEFAASLPTLIDGASSGVKTAA
jgi:hypothetical protein